MITSINKMISLLFISLSVLVYSQVSFANAGGSCHFHGTIEASKEAITQCAQQKIQKLIKKKNIDESWAQVTKPTNIEQINGKTGKEWKILFSNPNSPDESKKNLYMFFSYNGNFIAANFTEK
jgi:hypothetical protein